MRRFKDLALLVVYAALLSSVAIVHYGCEDEPTAPNDCGSGPFTRDSKTGVCRDVSSGSIVDPSCCP